MKKMWRFCLEHPCWTAFLIAFIPRLVFLIGINTMSISGDELFSFWPAAKMAGYDWSGAMSAYRYYGFGYTLLLYPFFLFIHNPTILYKTLVFIMILFQSCSAPIACHLAGRYFHVKKASLVLMIGIVCSYTVGLRAVYTYPEFLYDHLVWIVAWILMALTTKSSLKLTVLLWLVIGYACTVHSRGITLIFAALMAAVLYQLWFKKPLLHWGTTVVLALAAFLFYRFGIQVILNFLEIGRPVANTTVSVGSNSLSLLLHEPKSWISWFYIILGQVNEGIMMSAGLAIPVIWTVMKIVFTRSEHIPGNKEILCISAFCLTAIVITIGGQSITELPSVFQAMFQEGDWDAFRMVTYLRYYAPYATPLLLAGISALQNKKLLQTILVPSIITSGLLQGLFIVLVVPYINHFNGSVWSYAPFFGTKGFTDNISTAAYIAGSLAVFALQVLYLWLVKKKMARMILIVVSVVLIYVYSFNCLYHEGYRSRQNSDAVAEGVEYLNSHGIEKDIYVANHPAGSAGQGILWLYQFEMQQIPVKEYTSVPEEQDAVVITSDGADKNLLENGFSPADLANGWFIYERN